MKKHWVSAFLGLGLMLSAEAGFLDKEIAFSEAELQSAMLKNGPVEKNYGGVLTVTLDETPHIALGTPSGLATITARPMVVLLGQKPVPIEVQATAGIRYDESSKAFHLENPVVQSLESRALPKEVQPAARKALTQLLVSYFQTNPVYVLKDNGSAKERAARWLLKSVRIETGRVVATLSPF